MEEYRSGRRDYRQDYRQISMGLTEVDGGMCWRVEAAADSVKLLLYQKGAGQPTQVIPFEAADRIGDVWSLTVHGQDFAGVEYCFEIDGKLMSDPYGHAFTGREIWGDEEAAVRTLRSPVVIPEYDWEGDVRPEIPYEDSIIYRAHVRGLTKHTSSRVKDKGTFKAAAEKIPYMKELGVTALELMPVHEFPEVILPERVEGDPFGEDKPTGKLNYWGYSAGYSFAPKASYASKKAGMTPDPETELKDLVKKLHREGMELILELYFTGKESPSFVLDVVRYWVIEYHVDGLHIVGNAPLGLIGRDPYLTRTKLFAPSWEGEACSSVRHLAEYNDGFLSDMRRVLKGDENEMNELIFRSRRNPAAYGVINYMANSNGFTLMDSVCYDGKHNEANGEDNQDGTSWNYSWNCGVEGPSKKKKIVELRKKQLRNAFLLLLLSQGTPLIMAGDEFGNSQMGNNNAYCQDNDVSWLNWNLLKTNRDLYEFVRSVIAFRKNHSVFHQPTEPKLMDYRSCGQPDVSYHGVKAWCPEFESFRRQLGILYCGEYGKRGDGTADNSFYVAYNMHWEPHEFDLPNLPKKQKWFIAMDTDAGEVNGIYPQGDEAAVEGKQILVAARSIVVLIGKKDCTSAKPSDKRVSGGRATAAKKPHA